MRRLRAVARAAGRWSPSYVAAVLWMAGAPAGLVAQPLATDRPAREAVRSPNGAVVVLVRLVRGTRGLEPVYRVSYRGRTVVDDSPLGVEIAEDSLIGRDVRFGQVTSAAHDTTVRGLIGKASSARDHYQETTIAFVGRSPSRRRIELVVRAYDDGVAFRYRVPADPGVESALTVTGERTRFVVDPASTAYALTRSGYVSSYEGFYTVGPLGTLPADTLLALPLLLHHPGGAWMAVTEAALTDYAGMYLTRIDSTGAGAGTGTLASRLSPIQGAPNATSGVAAHLRAPIETPWRVILLGDAPGRLLESNLVTLLNPPSRIADVSWIHPGKTTFPWWNDYVLPDTTFKAGLNTATAKYYIDFCAAHAIPYHTLDGYQDLAWYGGHIDPGDSVPDVTRGNPALDLAEVLRYAKAKGVRLRVWTHWKALRPQLDTALAHYERMGIEGIMVDFMDHDDQPMLAFYHEVLAKAAAHHLTVVFHGAYKPTGMSRTWPNLMTVEAVMGLEYDKFDGTRGIPPAHEVTVPFTRMLAGPLDFHQGGFRYVSERDFHTRYTGPRVIGTRARTLAMYVVYEDYLPMMADAPSSYEGQPGLDFVARVPTTWDETRVVNGVVGEVATVARRRGREWYVGTMTDGNARDVRIPLRFLGPGRFAADMWSDSTGAPDRPRRERRVVTAATVIDAHLAPAGGHAIHLVPFAAGASSKQPSTAP